MSFVSVAVLSTNNSVHIEHVTVGESGDDSDDEWNYIQVTKEKPEEEHQTPVELEIEGEKIAKPAAGAVEIEEEAIITSPTPPTASLGEAEFTNQESHAIAQAFAEPEEVCTEVNEDILCHKYTACVCVCVFKRFNSRIQLISSTDSRRQARERSAAIA